MGAENPRPPFYIVGLPEGQVEAGDAKTKFEKVSDELCRVYPFIEEIRAVVKSKKPARTHSRYEVSVEIYTPRDVHAFTEEGYDIAAIFDSMGPKMKRLLSSRQSKVTSTRGYSLRKGTAD